jgi:hypothetical protein
VAGDSSDGGSAWSRARRALIAWLVVLAAIAVALAIVGLLAWMSGNPMYPAGR